MPTVLKSYSTLTTTKRSYNCLAASSDLLKTSQLTRSKKAKLGEAKDCTKEAYTMGIMLHDQSKSVHHFSQRIRMKAIPVNIKPLSHIFDGGDVSAEAFLLKWSTLLPTVAASDLAELLLSLVRNESLVLQSEFNKHKPMLKMLLAVIQDWKVLRSGLLTAIDIRSRDVASTLLGRLHELVPDLAVKLERQFAQQLQESSPAMQDQLDREEDARLAALEEDANSDDDDFIVDDVESDKEDGAFEPSSESEKDSDSSDDESTL